MGHEKRPRTVEFLPDGRHVISGSEDKTLRIWNCESGQEVARLEGDSHFTHWLALSPDGRFVVSGGGQYRSSQGDYQTDGHHAVHPWRLPEEVWPERADGSDRAAKKISNRFPSLVNAVDGAGLHLANCRLVMKDPTGHMIHTGEPACTVRNCEFSTKGGTAVAWRGISGGRVTIENSISAVGDLKFNVQNPDISGADIQLRRNTIVGNCTGLTLWTAPNLPEGSDAVPPIHMDVSGNIMHGPATFGQRAILQVHQFELDSPIFASDVEALLPQLIELDEQRNVYSSGTQMLRLATDWKPVESTRGRDLADWNRLWEQRKTGSVQGRIRFEGGDLVHRLWTADEELTAEDFRLRPDSAGDQAGPDGETLGANIDLVGPGVAHERWKQTPEYKGWLKESGDSLTAKNTDD